MRGLYEKRGFCHEKIKNTISWEDRVCMDSYPYLFHQMGTDEIIETEYLAQDREYVPPKD
jgi:predicted PolB exonuclease-like 3'-5' exonuclease